ncbi:MULTISPECIES: phage holin family protein [Rhodopseudomonas]|uniref:Phage holin family protein n=1 Tax=Rhodopseudomonas palustris TaxID=1076 RepID=A0A0D7E1A2_RHOPL|nr:MULTISPECIES: phage holin family protein [Rhodopseudomonas]KIZ34624.1 hypothetical protein OO17_26560 [Rhodopseudomonas palustris]MDF3812876.1 phage holin family protein [Rhodopseudomonas sp. BAL398]WOK17514.1 phage holin family protein [Rhodopseudomonas sp. BAL398]
MSSPSNRSIPDLISDAFGQLAKLVSNEFDLARAEMSDKASQVGRAVAMIGAGAVICIPALVMILFAIAAALVDNGLSQSIAYLVTGAGAALIALILIWIGLNRLSAGGLAPAVTLDQLQRDKVAAKEMVS